jgi:outer membrane immunogenic protein
MKRLLLAAVFLAGGSVAVSAADFIEPAPIVIEDDLFDWTGLYVGVQAGWVTGTVETEDFYCVNFPGDCYGGDENDRYFSEVDLSGFKGGVHIGYDHQFGQLVLGAESDLNLGGGSGDGGYFFYDFEGDVTEPGDPEETASWETLWEGSTRIKLGLALDRLMPYVTGGVAYGQAEASSHREWEDGPHDFEYSDINLIGYTVGVGAAYAMTDSIIVRGEARYTDYGVTNAAGVEVGEFNTHDIEVVGPKQFSLEGGISFKF